MAYSAATYLAAFRRRDNFTGMNDYYARANFNKKKVPGSIQDVIEGKNPFDVVGDLISPEMMESIQARLNEYSDRWRFYEGEHYANPYDEGELKPVFNFCRSIVDKGVDWFVAKGWRVKCPAGNEPVATVLDKVWEANHRNELTKKLAQFGSVTGDAYLYVTVATLAPDGSPLPKDKWRIDIREINPAYCTPFWSSTDPTKLKSILIQYPESGEDKNGTFEVYSMYITATKYYIYHDDRLVHESDNVFGEVNVIHIPNFASAYEKFGVSDIEDVIPVNEEYNFISYAIKKIIKYHAEPVTIIYGARVSNLEKGANKVWSNLPGEKSKVENLEMKSDLAASFTYLQHLQELINKLSNVPEVAFDAKNFSLSNTSGLAMQMQFQPLIEKTNRRRVTYRKGIQQANRLILIALQKILGQNIAILADEPEALFETDVEWTSPLPRDEQAELDAGSKKLAMGIWSQAELQRQLSGVNDLEKLALEIAADKRFELYMALEMQKATMGISPNPATPFLGSPFMSEDLEEVAQKVVDMYLKKMKENEKLWDKKKELEKKELLKQEKNNTFQQQPKKAQT